MAFSFRTYAKDNNKKTRYLYWDTKKLLHDGCVCVPLNEKKKRTGIYIDINILVYIYRFEEHIRLKNIGFSHHFIGKFSS